ncbi:MAG TPA: glycosyltransferase, partial [Polyangiaceae bacterium]|nr:glycosyltransferase [Polyangiaceae bacterium]
TARARAAAASYSRVPGSLLFAKTRFLTRTVQEQVGVATQKVEASLDHDMFYPAERAAGSSTRLVAMVRPQTPRRAAPRTMRVLREIARHCGPRVEIHLFGCASSDAQFQDLERDFAFTNHGVLRRPEVAALLRQSDVFIDLSEYQAFGRASLEAMASGSVPVVPLRGGGDEFAVDGKNAVVVDTAREPDCVERIVALVEQPLELARMRSAALARAAHFSVRGAVLSELDVLLSATLARRSAQATTAPRKRLALARLGGVPRGRLATGAVQAGWKLPCVQRAWHISEGARLPKPGSAEVAVVVLPLAQANWTELAAWLGLWRGAQGRVVVQVELTGVGLSKRGQPRLSGRALAGLRWLARAADALAVSSAPLQQALTARELESVLVPLVLDPILWRLGPAALPRVEEPSSDGPVRVGLRDGRRYPELLHVARGLKRRYGARVVVEPLGGLGVAQLGKRLREAAGRDEAELAEQAFERVRWDIALLPAVARDTEQELRRLELAALGVAAAPIGDDATAAAGILAGLVEHAGARSRQVAAQREALEDAYRAADTEAVAARLLARLLEAPVRAAPAELPRSLRGLAGKLLSRGYERRFMEPELGTPFPGPRSKAQRKLEKLRRDPGAFLRDSTVKRKLDELRRKWRR